MPFAPRPTLQLALRGIQPPMAAWEDSENVPFIDVSQGWRAPCVPAPHQGQWPSCSVKTAPAQSGCRGLGDLGSPAEASGTAQGPPSMKTAPGRSPTHLSAGIYLLPAASQGPHALSPGGGEASMGHRWGKF